MTGPSHQAISPMSRKRFAIVVWGLLYTPFSLQQLRVRNTEFMLRFGYLGVIGPKIGDAAT